MTREEAIKVLNMVEAHGIAEEAKQMAISALKSIEQIRDEIEQYEVECMLILPMTEQTCNRCTNDTFKNIYQIIDHYTK